LFTGLETVNDVEVDVVTDAYRISGTVQPEPCVNQESDLVAPLTRTVISGSGSDEYARTGSI
jgi:hypothetical protein